MDHNIYVIRCKLLQLVMLSIAVSSKRLDRQTEPGLTSHQTHYRSYRGRVSWVKWPNQQCQSTEGR